MFVDYETRRLPRRGGFGLYYIVCKVYPNVASCDETKCDLTDWNAG
jgi:hypothetical protein